MAMRQPVPRSALAVGNRALDTLVSLVAPDARFSAENGTFAP